MLEAQNKLRQERGERHLAMLNAETTLERAEGPREKAKAQKDLEQKTKEYEDAKEAEEKKAEEREAAEKVERERKAKAERERRVKGKGH